MSKRPEQIVALVQAAGVIGAAGTGFPTHVKLQAQASIVIVNAAECEPLVCTDRSVLCAHADDVVLGLRLAMTAVGAREGVIAVNREFGDAVAAVRAAIDRLRAAASGGNLTVHLMGNYYPAGDEFNAVYDVTGNVVPEGGTPLDVGVLVLNVTTARQIYQAVNGIAAVDRTVTVAGTVREPRVMTVPIGTRYSELIAMAGGLAERSGNVTVFDGGPMMGTVVPDLDAGIGKSTSALLVLPSDHYVVRMKTKTVAELARQSRGVGSLRTEMTDLCPRHLLGHSLQPHEAMTALDYSRAEPSHPVTAAYLCSGCGVCELAADEATFLSPKKIYGEFRARLLKAGIRNPHTRSGLKAHSQYENRKLALPTLIRKLGLGDFVAKPATIARPASPAAVSLVRVPTARHVGEPACAQVRLTQQVRRGDLIAASPDGFLGALYHAPIHGRVTDVTSHYIEITGEAS